MSNKMKHIKTTIQDKKIELLTKQILNATKGSPVLLKYCFKRLKELKKNG